MRQTYPSAKFLEGYANAVKRFESKQVIIFRYVQYSSNRVIKYYGLDHLEPTLRLKEKKAVLDEFMLAAAFKGHRGVINVYDHNVLLNNKQEVGAYYSMDYLETTLDKLFARRYQFSNNEVLSFLRQMNDVLSHAHFRAGIIHSDIKPANIGVVKQNGALVYKLMDFDVSVRIEKETTGGNDLNFSMSDKINIRGMTPAYAAPEQVMSQIGQGTTITGKSDTYAVGVIAVQMLTGIPPRQQAGSIFYQVPLYALPKQWHAILGRICYPDIKHRPRKIEDVLPPGPKPKPNPNPGYVKNRAVALTTLTLIFFVIVIYVNHLASDATSRGVSPPPDEEISTPHPTPQQLQQPQLAPQLAPQLVADEEPTDDEPIEVVEEPVTIEMPDLQGRTLHQARSMLRSRGLRVQRIIYQDSSVENEDRIINTRPAAGTSLDADHEGVILIVGEVP